MMENHAAPIISYYTYYHVGTRNERVDNSGISHFLEHMFFNGAKKYGPKMFDKTIEAAGGYSNAWTSKDMTAYYQVFSSDILELVFDLESDRMANLALEEHMIKSEAGVVSEERLMTTDNDNQGIMWEELHAAAFTSHPYGTPVLGWMASIKKYNRKDVLEYFKMYYAPNNAVVTIVGDFDTEWALVKMKEYFGDIPSGPPPLEVPWYEPEQIGARRVMIEKPARHEHIYRGYHICDKDSPDLIPLEYIQFILTTGESSRMQQALVNDLQISMGQYGGFSWGFDPQLFYFYQAVIPGQNHPAVENAFDSVLTDFITNGPTEDEMTKARNGLTARFYGNYTGLLFSFKVHNFLTVLNNIK